MVKKKMWNTIKIVLAGMFTIYWQFFFPLRQIWTYEKKVPWMQKKNKLEMIQQYIGSQHQKLISFSQIKKKHSSSCISLFCLLCKCNLETIIQKTIFHLTKFLSFYLEKELSFEFQRYLLKDQKRSLLSQIFNQILNTFFLKYT